MRKFHPLFSLRTKLFVAFFGVAVFITMAMAYGIYKHMRTDHINTLRQELMNMAAVASLQIDGDMLEQMITPEQENTPEYMEVRKKLNNISEQVPQVKDIYTLRTTDQPGIYAFIIDASPDLDYAQLGELYDGNAAPAIAEGFIKPSADAEFVTDQWGTTLSGYAPIYNSSNQVVAIVGIDMDADTIVNDLTDCIHKVIKQSLVIIIVFAGVIYILSNSFARRLEVVNNAIDELTSGNLNIALAVDGQDEISQLTSRINSLAVALHSEREDMLLSAIKALVNALEAKDKYTHGHSAEVEAISIQISRALGLPEEEILEIAISAILHDIGKIGIPDQLINKRDKLTDEEWFLVKQHPRIGAKIISGIPFIRDVAQIVIHHHARYDGKGYPEPIAGRNIPLGARIIAVADSFQAMISDRSYRKGMPIANALAEIKRCAGTQFDPEIVKVFLKLYNNQEKCDHG